MPYMGHSMETMLSEFERYRKNAVMCKILGIPEEYTKALSFAAAFLEAAYTFPF